VHHVSAVNGASVPKCRA